MPKMPQKKPLHPDVVLRVAIFNITDNVKKLTHRIGLVRAQGVDPNWELTATIQLQAIQAWASNCTAAQALGVLTSEELSTILQNLSIYEMAMKDLIEQESGKTKLSDKTRLTNFKQTLSFLMGEIEDMASSQPDHHDELMNVGSDLNDIEDRLEAVLTEMKDE